MQGVFERIEELLRTERELFGERMIVDPPHQQEKAGTMRPERKQTQAPQNGAGRGPTQPQASATSSRVEVPLKKEPRTYSKRSAVPAAEEMRLFEPPSPAPISGEPWATASSLEILEEKISGCQKCALGQTRTKFVFGVGNPDADLMLIGEAPGADEDAQGEPFVGRAGQLLNKILEAIGLRRQDVYICNILKCRPPGNRKPSSAEADLCLPYLRKQIALVRPKLILCLGLTAAENLLGTTESLTRLRGNILRFDGLPVMVTYHPAALLRNPAWKRPTWEDVQAARRMLDESAGSVTE